MNRLTDKEMQEYLDGGYPGGEEEFRRRLALHDGDFDRFREYCALYGKLDIETDWEPPPGFTDAVLENIPVQKPLLHRALASEALLLTVSILTAVVSSLLFIDTGGYMQKISAVLAGMLHGAVGGIGVLSENTVSVYVLIGTAILAMFSLVDRFASKRFLNGH